MGWKVNFVADDDGNEKSVNLDDLSPETFAAIAKEVDAGLTYWGIYGFPRETPEILYRVICAAAEHLGVDAPERPTDMRGQKILDAMLEPVEDIEDQPMQDGFPKVPSETESGSSTTSLDLPTGGSPTTLEDSP